MEHMKKKRAVYFGMDALQGCLELLTERGYEIVQICTMPDDSYDRTVGIQNYAREHQIPCELGKVTPQKIQELAAAGAELMVSAGYAWKIPVCQKVRQINIHPAYLPEGRGSWPMPAAILRGRASGVTIHKLDERFDEGDILLQEPIEIREQDNLETLMEGIREMAVRLLGEFLDHPEELWENARPQGNGEYWEEPGDDERTFCIGETPERVSRLLRAFYGYGCLCRVGSVLLEIVRGSVVKEGDEVKGASLMLPLAEGQVVCHEWQLAFRRIRLEDKEAMERIRGRYQPELSDYTFVLLYCWQETMELSVYLEEDFYVVKSRDYFFFPVGSKERTKEFIDGLLALGISPVFRFCDRQMRAFAESAYFGRIVCEEAEGDGDYVLDNRVIRELPGKGFATRRKEFSHFSRLEPKPLVERITEENIGYLQELSAKVSGADAAAEARAVRHYFELGLIGILVRRGGEYVGFSICSEKEKGTMQGHFMKCIETEKGSKFYLMKSCLDAFSDRYEHTNIEDDMGNEGLRKYKRSLKPEIIPSYTISI